MIRSAVMLAAAAAIALASPAAQAAGITYDCDTAADHFSELVLPAPSGVFTVSGTVQTRAIPKVGKYAPLIRVEVGSPPPAPGEAQADSAGLKLTALPASAFADRRFPKGSIVQALSWDGMKDGKRTESEAFGLSVGQQPISFTMRYDGAELMTQVGDKQQVTRLAVQEPVVRVICSTGEFLLTQFTITPAGPRH